MSTASMRVVVCCALLAGVLSAQTQLLGSFPGCGGFSILATDDWDGDGIGDVVRSCAAGQILVVSSSSAVTLATLQVPFNGSLIRVQGTIADLDQDGHREVIVSDFYLAGSVSCWSFASPGAPLWQRPLAPSGYARIYRAFAIVGDVDGDGVSDVAAGYPGAGPCPNSSFAYGGALEILSGASGAVLRSHTSAVGDGWPEVVAAPGDVTGDGIPDYVVAGSGHPASSFPGCLPAMPSRVTAFSGAAGSAVLWQTPGPPASALGSFVDAIGDFDGDQDVDLLVRGNLLPGPTGFEAVVDAATGAWLLHSQTPGVPITYSGGAPVGDLNGDLAVEFVTPGPNGALVRSGGTGASLYELAGVMELPVPIADLDGDGRVDFAIQIGSGQTAPGWAGWLLVSVRASSPVATAAWFGVGCGAGGPTPGLVMSGPPYFGWNRTLAYVNGPPGASASIFVGAPGPATPLGGGCNVLLDLAQPITLLWNPTLDASGAESAIFLVPAIPGFAGTALRLQGGHFVAGGGLALTAAIDLTFGF